VSTLEGLQPATVERIRARLEADSAALTQRLGVPADGAAGPDRTAATHGHGETEHVQIEIDRALETTLQQAARDTLEDIASALARLDDGSYGRCTTCGVHIPRPRLELVPTTQRCVQCQEHRERRA
jgi:DnaK suppressor protein